MNRIFALLVSRVVVPSLYWLVSHRRYGVVLAMCTGDVRNSAGGESCVGGTRGTRAGYREWWRRLFRLCRSIRPRADQIRVDGGLRAAQVVVDWTDHITAWDGKVFVNRGQHSLRLKWGRIVYVHQAWDEDLVNEQARYTASLGYPEALEAPVGDR